MRKYFLLISIFAAALCFDSALAAKKKNTEKDVYKHLVYVKDAELSKLKDEQKARLDEIAGIAKSDQELLMKMAVEHYKKNIKDYTGTFTKQERVGKKLLKEQVIDFKFRDKPFSIYLEFTKNAMSSDKVLYVEGKNDNKMIAHPVGMFSFLDSVKREPDCKAAMKENIYPCTMFGFYKMMEKARGDNANAKKAGDLKLKYLGITKVDGKLCVAAERVLPRRRGMTIIR